MMAIIENDGVAPMTPASQCPCCGGSCAIRLEAAVETVVERDDRLLVMYFPDCRSFAGRMAHLLLYDLVLRYVSNPR